MFFEIFFSDYFFESMKVCPMNTLRGPNNRQKVGITTAFLNSFHLHKLALPPTR